MIVTSGSLEAYNLLHDGILALADIEAAGIRVDVRYCKKKQKHVARRIAHMEQKIEEYPEVQKWKKKYRREFNLESNQQFADILFNEMGYKPVVMTKTNKPSVSQAAIEQIEIPVVRDIVQLKRLVKVNETYLGNYIREQIDGYLHPFFHLHTAQTYRSSASNINFQNQPVRIPEIKKTVRQAVIPRKGYMIGELDYSGAEVKGACCYHKDPNMMDELTNPKKDMHRDMAMACYSLSPNEWTKDTRYCGKNKFVFPQFYGDYYVNCAKNLWEAISIMKLETKAGKPLKEHLESKGILSYGIFEKHIEKVEQDFWGVKFKVYNKWKEAHWEAYQKNGYVDLLTGFRCSGLMSRNEAINYPVQGAAFHFLLWSLIQLHNWLMETGKKTMIIGQIHDSIVLDMHPDEINEVLAKATEIMTVRIVEHWPWIIVPLSIDAELTSIDQAWLHKKEVKQTDFDCKCSNHWMWKKTDEETDTDYWKCPSCGNKYQIQGTA